MSLIQKVNKFSFTGVNATNTFNAPSNFNGWNAATIAQWVSQCNNLGRDCGAYLIGSGQLMTGGEARP